MDSLRERLRAQRERQLAPKTLTLRVPGWDDPEVHVRYRPLAWERLVAMLGAGDDGPGGSLIANVQALVDACDALVIREEGDASPSSLAERLREQGEDIAGEIRFSEFAAELLGLTVPDADGASQRPARTARDAVRGLFAGAVSPEIAIADHAARLGAWMRGIQEEVDEALLGE